MFFQKQEGLLIVQDNKETVMIEAWGTNALRIRATKSQNFTGKEQALTEMVNHNAYITLSDDTAFIQNGKISCVITNKGVMTFYKENKMILKEYYRDDSGANEHTKLLRTPAREYKYISGNDYQITLRFEANESEKIFGMGQYQQENLDLKGNVLELMQRNTQTSIPFYISSQGYGFLWNNPSIGEVMFGTNYTKWYSRMSEEFDYWITADDTPKDLLRNYTEVTGRAPKFPENALGLWQSKLRYRTQDELMEVAREYHKRGIPLDVIVIDYFHWVRQGDWAFDSDYWPDPQAMMDELKEMGIRLVISIWTTVDKKSVNYEEMKKNGWLVKSKVDENAECMEGGVLFVDAFSPECRDFVWKIANENYGQYGIDTYWLDVAEPEFQKYDFENWEYCNGDALKVTNQYPVYYTKLFYDGLKEQGKEDIVSLVRGAWAGSQKYAALVWSGDINSNFTTLRDQLSAGLNVGLAGIPWWTTDTGGFIGNVTDEHFNELLVRWFQFSTFCAVLRLHGDRGPFDIPPLSTLDYGGGFCHTGRPNELWSYGEEVYEILKKYLDIRLSMKDYIQSLMEEASDNGSPIIRTMFYEFPDDEICWNLKDQYMFGDKYLVAPVMYQGVTEREVYLPAGTWKNIHDGHVHEGNQSIVADAPIDIIPVYERI